MSFGLSGTGAVVAGARATAESAAGIDVVSVVDGAPPVAAKHGARPADDQEAGEGEDEGGAVALHVSPP